MSEKKYPKVPKMGPNVTYTDWVRMVSWWKIRTDLAADKQGLELASTLEGKALDAVLELSDDDINAATGVDKIITKLDTLYKKNELEQKIEDIEKFENFKRSDELSIK